MIGGGCSLLRGRDSVPVLRAVAILVDEGDELLGRVMGRVNRLPFVRAVEFIDRQARGRFHFPLIGRVAVVPHCAQLVAVAGEVYVNVYLVAQKRMTGANVRNVGERPLDEVRVCNELLVHRVNVGVHLDDGVNHFQVNNVHVDHIVSLLVLSLCDRGKGGSSIPRDSYELLRPRKRSRSVSAA